MAKQKAEGNPTFNNIPFELTIVKQWVCWRLINRKDSSTGEVKATKVPCQPNGTFANSTNAATWSKFETCVKAAHKFSGIGFVFAEGYVGVDLDKVRDPETGITEPWALNITRELNSYTEMSQSGTGWHVIVAGELPPGGNRKGRVEMYEKDRFFVMTGNWEPTSPCSIHSRDLSSLHDRLIQGKLDPKPLEPSQQNGSQSSGVIRANGTVDESAVDYKLIARTADKLKSRDAQAIEDSLEQEHGDRFYARQETKGNRAGKTYWQYSIEKYLKSTENISTKASRRTLKAVKRIKMGRKRWPNIR